MKPHLLFLLKTICFFFILSWQMAYATQTTPTSDFIDNSDGTVTHKTTGLMWQRCAVGQTWTGSICSGTASTYTYDAALALTSDFAGKRDWRLPNIAELQTIVEFENASPAINNTLFPNAPSSAYSSIWFWSSSPDTSGDYPWVVNFGVYTSGSRNDNKNNNNFVRLVRGGQWIFGSLPLTTPTADFIDNADGTVTHKRTGLIWQRCVVGQTWTGSSCSGTARAITYVTALALTSDFAGQSDWRLPNQNELLSIVEYGAYSPAINSSIFPTPLHAWFWSSSLNANIGSDAWSVNFDNGGGYYGYVFSGHFVRLVRGKWTAKPSVPKDSNVVLLLHGMNTTPDTWNSIVSSYFADNCPIIGNGKISESAQLNAKKTYCYRVKFGAFDATNINNDFKGLEKDAWNYGNTHGHARAGDFSTFDQLGTEVDNAISAIKKTLPSANILLIGHSRGGLAARAFLQSSTSVNKSSVVGLITTGTPHEGTRMGRIHNYIATKLLDIKGKRITNSASTKNDWNVVDFLIGKIGCNAAVDIFIDKNFQIDARRPVIGFLADNSPLIDSLKNTIGNLPTIKYGELIYDGTSLGKLASVYDLFHEHSSDICPQVSGQAEAFIKGGTFYKPTPSAKYSGDGIVTASSQGSAILPSAKKSTYKLNVLHTEEPEQISHIADMTCKLGFPWLTACNNEAAVGSKSRQTTIKTAEIVSHDYDALTVQKTEQLWQDWLAIITDDAQTNQRESLAVALGLKLRSSDNSALVADIKQRLFDSNATALERARLAMLLAEIATPSALEILTDALLQADLSASQTALSNAIIHVADSLPEPTRRADLSAVLENAWLSAMTASPLRTGSHENTLATAIAKLGTARGVELLLSAIDKTGEKLPFSSRKPKNQAERLASAAFSAMDSIINIDSETVLSNAFSSHKANEAVFIAAGNGLVNLGSETAAQLVLQRLDEVADAIAQQWLNSLSGKVEKTALRRIGNVAKPRKSGLRKQFDGLVQ